MPTKTVQGLDSHQPRPIGKITKKLLDLQGRVGTMTKDKTNPHFKYQYVSAQAVNEIVKPILQELGLVVIANTERSESQGGLVIATTTLTLIDVESGEQLTFSSVGGGTDSGDKAPMKAATAAQKYATIALVFGATQDDPEADAKTDIRSSRQPAARLAAAAPSPAQKAPAATATPVGENGELVIEFEVGKVFNGNKTASGNIGPGTIVAIDGTKYDTFDKGLVEVARGAVGRRVNVMYKYDEKYRRNTITEDGLSLCGDANTDIPAGADNTDGQHPY